MRRATLRATAPTCRSSCRTPLSRVYLLITSRHRVVGERHVLVAEPRLLELTRNQILLRDLRLLALRVARELDDFHSVEQRARDVLNEIGGRDEQHFAQVERYSEIVIGEVVVLRRIEHLEQRARRIALERHAELVDFVEQEDGILRARLLHALNDATGHRADVGAPVAADVGLVARAAERDADVLASERTRDRLRDRRLADARRSDEEQDRSLRHRAGLRLLRIGDRPVSSSAVAELRRRVFLASLRASATDISPVCLDLLCHLLRAKLTHGEELEHAILHVRQAVVILVEHRPARA